MDLFSLLIQLVYLETHQLSFQDQHLYGLALLAPFSGIALVWWLRQSLTGALRALTSIIIPLGWSSLLGYALWQVTSSGLRLLILSYSLSLALTGLHLAIVVILETCAFTSYLFSLSCKLLSLLSRRMRPTKLTFTPHTRSNQSIPLLAQ